MFNITPVSSVIEEVARNSWPPTPSESSILEESSWEILNRNSSHSFLKRHWFKQNYGNDQKQQETVVNYH
jgi:hypothetical protein